MLYEAIISNKISTKHKNSEYNSITLLIVTATCENVYLLIIHVKLDVDGSHINVGNLELGQCQTGEPPKSLSPPTIIFIAKQIERSHRWVV